MIGHIKAGCRRREGQIVGQIRCRLARVGAPAGPRSSSSHPCLELLLLEEEEVEVEALDRSEPVDREEDR